MDKTYSTIQAECHIHRQELENQVLARLKTMDSVANKISGQFLDPQSTVIVADIAPYSSAKEADAAEMKINWFSPADAVKRRACRVAFAAMELQYYLRLISGSKTGFNIVTKSSRNKSLLVFTLDENEARTDGSFEIAADGNTYIFRGLSIQGCLYAVYEYLEQLECSFLRPGRSNEYIPKLKKIPAPLSTTQTPGFPVRRLHGWRKNYATDNLIDWMGKSRINMWGADNLVPGMRKRGILLSSGMHDILPVAGVDRNFCICNEEHKHKLLTGIIEAFDTGPWKDADVCDYIGADWGKRCGCDKCKSLGNASDIELRILHEIRTALHQAYLDGRINRDLPVFGYAYFDSEEPPANPMPANFDNDAIGMELWSMRCWEHFINEPVCNEDFPIISTMNDFLGKRMELPSNIVINRRLNDWCASNSHFTGQFGFGYYFSNAGNYWLPLLQMAIISYELPYLHSLGCKRLGYMHIQPDNWGPQAVTNMLYSKLAWNVSANAAELLAKYFKNTYGDTAIQMAKAYFDLEKSLANVFNIKRFIIKGLAAGIDWIELSSHTHVTGLCDTNKAVLNLNQMAKFAETALKSVKKNITDSKTTFIDNDLPWFEYAHATITLYRAVFGSIKYKETNDTAAATKLLRSCPVIINKLKELNLEICLPEKVRVDCAEASGILGVLNSVAGELGIDIALDNCRVQVQTSIEPVPAQLADKGSINPTRWNADPKWSVIDDADEIGIELAELITTNVKHQGIVAQRIGGEMILAAVGDDRASNIIKVVEWDVFDGFSAVCFTGSGQLLWKHDYNTHGMRVATGPWPAFIDITGKGDWAVSVFTIYDGGQGNRKGILYLYEALSGKLIWQRAIPQSDYPGGNGSCVYGDLDNNGRIEIIYGLSNCVMCVDALTGRPKWVYDDRIKICHGRLSLCDVNDDGLLEIVVASEYGDSTDSANDRSSIIVLDASGHLVYKMRNIQGDLGSTQIVIADVDNDGKPEIIHGSENLCFHEPRHMAELFVRERWLVDKLDAVPVGGARFAVGDIDGDGYPEAIGITNYRDGGPHVKPEIYCVRLLDGRIKWKRPVSRVWFDGDAIMADVDGDGMLETIVTAQYSSGYMQKPGTQPWGDLYILKGDGRIIYKKTFADAVFSPIAVDSDGDGKVEIVIGCYDGTVYTLKTKGPACDADWPVPCRNMQRTGVYPNYRKN